MRTILLWLMLVIGCAFAWAQPVDIGLDIPAENEGLPGQGPLRRGDWFRKVWRERRQLFAASLAQDRGAVVFLGDSITQGWGQQLGVCFPGLHTANRGISGDTTRGVLLRLAQDVLTVKPRAVVLLIGTNDLAENAEPETIAENLREILQILQDDQPSMPILLCAVLPSSAAQQRPVEKINQINLLYRELAAEFPQVTYLDTWSLFANDQGDARPEEFPDLLHPNAAGYTKWATVLRPALAEKKL